MLLRECVPRAPGCVNNLSIKEESERGIFNGFFTQLPWKQHFNRDKPLAEEKTFEVKVGKGGGGSVEMLASHAEIRCGSQGADTQQ